MENMDVRRENMAMAAKIDIRPHLDVKRTKSDAHKPSASATILLFNGLRQSAIIWLLVPMSVNGAALGLVGTGLPFTFTALLGLLSLSGMLIKNGIVLVEEIDLTRAAAPDMPLSDAITQASVSRLRPVLLAAATTILGMIPLLSDAFFASMAVTIMGGLAFASVLTLIAAPVFYMMFFNRVAARQQAEAVPA